MTNNESNQDNRESQLDSKAPLPQVWYEQNSEYFVQSQQSTVKELPIGIYELRKSRFGLRLSLQTSEFALPKKIYGITTSFVDKVIKTWEKKGGNLGVLMWGLKGTSKTVTAKIICNKLKLPVILVSFNDKRFPSFMDEISQDVIVLFDEFEKIFGADSSDEDDNNNNNGSLLSLLDGTSTTTSRRFWLFTSNTEYLEKNLLDRPGRIRYCKQFGALDSATIIPIVDDLLKIEVSERYDELRLDLLKTISRLEHRTIDAIFALVEEVNIHQELASNLIQEFNLHEKTEKYRVTRQRVDENENLVIDPAKGGKDEEFLGIYHVGQMNMRSFSVRDEDCNFSLKRKVEARVVRAVNQSQAIMIKLPSNYKEDIDANGDKIMINANEDCYTYWLYTLEPVYSSLFDF